MEFDHILLALRALWAFFIQTAHEVHVWASSLWDYLAQSPTLNSPFITGFVGAGFGALAGAWAAQRIAMRAKRRDELLSEMRSVNAAIGVAYSIFQAAVRLKVSGTQNMHNNFLKDKADIIEFNERKTRGEIPGNQVIKFKADLETITPFPIPSDHLQTLVFEKLNIIGRPYQIVLQIPQIWHSLTEVIILRNDVIKEFRVGYPRGEIPPHIYFGWPDREGHVDARYSSALEGIWRQMEDCLWFSKTLCKDLQQHGDRVRKLCVRRFGKKAAPRITEINFDELDAKGLLPSDEDYRDWQTKFVIRPPEPTLISRIAAVIRSAEALEYSILGRIWRWIVRAIRRLYFAISFRMLWSEELSAGGPANSRDGAGNP